MSADLGIDLGTAVPCRNPECDGTAETEQDGDHQFLACPTCGFEFGWTKVETAQLAVDEAGTCAIGVPETIRRAFPGPAAKPQPISLGSTIPVRSSQ